MNIPVLKQTVSFLCFALLGVCSVRPGLCSEPISIQAKSFIALVDLTDSSQFEPGSKSCQTAMAAVVDCGTLNENPLDGSKGSGAFRLRSELTGTATCTGANLTNWSLGPVQQDFGSEFVVFATSGDLAKPLTAVPGTKGSAPVAKITFNYRLRGQPNAAGVAAMNAVKPRTCSFIWHAVSGTLSCQSGKLVVAAAIGGSKFPSHRLWVQGKAVQTVPQGKFKNLWNCDPANPALVQ
jgi:hypothetical protein